MKAFFAIILLAALASAEYKVKSRNDLARYKEECAKELNVPPDHLEKFKNAEFPNNFLTRLYKKCILEKMEILNRDTGFNVRDVYQQIVGGGHFATLEGSGKVIICQKLIGCLGDIVCNAI